MARQLKVLLIAIVLAACRETAAPPAGFATLAVRVGASCALAEDVYVTINGTAMGGRETVPYPGQLTYRNLEPGQFQTTVWRYRFNMEHVVSPRYVAGDTTTLQLDCPPGLTVINP